MQRNSLAGLVGWLVGWLPTKIIYDIVSKMRRMKAGRNHFRLVFIILILFALEFSACHFFEISFQSFAKDCCFIHYMPIAHLSKPIATVLSSIFLLECKRAVCHRSSSKGGWQLHIIMQLRPTSLAQLAVVSFYSLFPTMWAPRKWAPLRAWTDSKQASKAVQRDSSRFQLPASSGQFLFFMSKTLGYPRIPTDVFLSVVGINTLTHHE